MEAETLVRLARMLLLARSTKNQGTSCSVLVLLAQGLLPVRVPTQILARAQSQSLIPIASA